MPVFNITPHLLLFLPLIISLCQILVKSPKISLAIFVSGLFAMLFLVANFGLDLEANSGIIKSGTDSQIISITTEYSLDSLSIFFSSLALLIILIAVIGNQQNLSKNTNGDERLFYSTNLLALFGLFGIFSTNNIFNLFIFVEIYCLTTCALMAVLNSKSAFKYFCWQALSGILFLVACILLYISCGQFEIDKIFALQIIKNSDLILAIFIIAIFLKFFPIFVYFAQEKDENLQENFFDNQLFIIGNLVGFYLLLKLSLFLFHPGKIFSSLIAAIGLFLISYGNYKIIKEKYLKLLANNFCLIGLGFTLVGIGFFGKTSLQSSLIYIANYLLFGVAIFIFAEVISKKQNSENLVTTSLPIALNIFTILMPITLIFWSSWHLSILAFDYEFGILAIIAIAITNLSVIFLLTHPRQYHIYIYPPR
ncbi:MAG: putative Na+/H+ antiporter subunit [Rickettsiaceae bacterium]|nr:putative Na+/H+ antiporter subunit [Rickettsiaceae bacterium]